MSTAEIIDASLRLYQRLGLTFLRVTVAPALMSLAAVAFVTEYVIPGLFYSEDGGSFTTHLGQVAVALVLAVFVGGPLFLSGLSYSTALVVSLVSDTTLERPVDLAAAQDAARAAMPRLLVVMMRELIFSLAGIILASVVMLLSEWMSTVMPETDIWTGVVALVGVFGLGGGGLIALWVLSIDGVVAPATILENLSARQAGKRSRELMKKARIHGSGTSTVWNLYTLIGFLNVMLLTGIYVSASYLGVHDRLESFTAGWALQPLVTRVVDLLPLYLSIWTLQPVWATSMTLLYFDRRIRLEGFDIEVLGRDLARNTRANRLQL